MPAQDALAQRIEAAERKAQAAAEKLKQLKARKAAIEARQRAAEAKRSRRILEVGALVKRAGLLDLDNATLLGALMIVAGRLDDLAYRAEARQRGQAVLDKSTKPGGAAVTQAPA